MAGWPTRAEAVFRRHVVEELDGRGRKAARPEGGESGLGEEPGRSRVAGMGLGDDRISGGQGRGEIRAGDRIVSEGKVIGAEDDHRARRADRRSSGCRPWCRSSPGARTGPGPRRPPGGAGRRSGEARRTEDAVPRAARSRDGPSGRVRRRGLRWPRHMFRGTRPNGSGGRAAIAGAARFPGQDRVLDVDPRRNRDNEPRSPRPWPDRRLETSRSGRGRDARRRRPEPDGSPRSSPILHRGARQPPE